jgi:hypothetical protein
MHCCHVTINLQLILHSAATGPPPPPSIGAAVLVLMQVRATLVRHQNPKSSPVYVNKCKRGLTARNVSQDTVLYSELRKDNTTFFFFWARLLLRLGDGRTPLLMPVPSPYSMIQQFLWKKKTRCISQAHVQPLAGWTTPGTSSLFSHPPLAKEG